jgi:hypothetical protein
MLIRPYMIIRLQDRLIHCNGTSWEEDNYWEITSDYNDEIYRMEVNENGNMAL